MHETKNPVLNDLAQSEMFPQEIPVALVSGTGHIALRSEAAQRPADHIEATGLLPAEQSTDAERSTEQKFAEAGEWLRHAESGVEDESTLADIASGVSILAQKELNGMDEDDMMDDRFYELKAIRDKAINAAGELDFELVELTRGNWPLHAQLNVMHEKFNTVSAEALNSFLGSDDSKYEYRALFIRDIIADHAPTLLTEDLKTLVDPSQPLWRSSSAHASIVLRNTGRTNADDIHVDKIPVALPVGNRIEYAPEDALTMKPVASMSDEELALYARPDAIDTARERGYVRFDELTLPTRQTLLTRRLFETTGKSNSPEAKGAASERNKALGHEPVFQEGDLVHATGSVEVLDAVLANGLRCGEAVMGNARSVIKYPFTVSMLEVTKPIAEAETVAEKLDLLKNSAYGAINLIMHRDESATPHTEGQNIGVPNQRQVFGGMPSTEIKSIVIRDQKANEQTIAKVIQSIVKNGMFVPVYRGSTGEQLLTSEQFDQFSTQAA